VTRGQKGAFARLERGELSLDEFYVEWKRELEDPEQIKLYCDFKKTTLDPSYRISVDTKALFTLMLEKSLRVDPDFMHAIYVLRGSGFKVGSFYFRNSVTILKIVPISRCSLLGYDICRDNPSDIFLQLHFNLMSVSRISRCHLVSKVFVFCVLF
jgi:hypothetical protein